jgi:Predicted dehydrogenases and related proteins
MSLGMVGEPYLAYGYLVRRRGIPGSPTFIDKQLSGGRGALLDIGCYILDNLLSLLNFPRPVTVSGATYTKFGRNPEEVKFNWGSWDPSKFELEDYAVGFIRFENGASMIIEVVGRPTYPTWVRSAYTGFSVTRADWRVGATRQSPK